MSAALEKARSGARPEEKEAAQAAAEAAEARYECLKAGSRGEEIHRAEAELKARGSHPGGRSARGSPQQFAPGAQCRHHGRV